MKIVFPLLLVALIGCSVSNPRPTSNSPPANSNQTCRDHIIMVHDTVFFMYPKRDTVYVNRTEISRAPKTDTVYVRSIDTVYVSQPVEKKEMLKCHEVTDVYQMCDAFTYNPWYKYISIPYDPVYTTNRDTLDKAIAELNRVCPQKAKLTHYDYPVDLTAEDYVNWLRRLGINISKRFERVIVNREAADYAEFLMGGIIVRYRCVPD